MRTVFDEFTLTDEKDALDMGEIQRLLSKTYWASERTEEEIEVSVRNSLCYSLYHKEYLVGFARIVTDYVSVFWLCDVVVDEDYRGRGLSKRLLDFIFTNNQYKGLGILITEDTHGLYERYGYKLNRDNFMIRSN